MVYVIVVMNVLMEVRLTFFFLLIKIFSFLFFEGYCSNLTSKCECLSGYGGLMCELDINECAGNDRICGSYSCTNLPGDYKCDCDFFRSGKQCQKSKKNIYLI